MPSALFRMSRTPGRVNWLGPDLGQHTDEVLSSIGLTADDLRELRSRRVV
jgi:crotonobetainyl-CoA:carnitine CoA-transferase CaiB-like acyl-CoA transferase